MFGTEILEYNNQESSSIKKTETNGEAAFLRIDGMHCSSCEVLIEHLALRIDGILSATSSYATSTAKLFLVMIGFNSLNLIL